MISQEKKIAKAITNKGQLATYNLANRLVKQDPEDHAAYGLLAGILLEIGMKKEAINYYSRAINIASYAKKSVYLAKRAEAYAFMGDSKLALEDIERIKTLPKGDKFTELLVKSVIAGIISNTGKQLEN